MTGAEGPILFASAEHPGQLNPLLSIATELSGRGVTDLWVSTQQDAAERVAACGTARPLGFLSTGPTRARIDARVYAAMTRGPMTTAGTAALGRLISREAVAGPVYAETLRHIEKIAPALMVIDVLDPGALDAALARRIPFVLSIPFPASGVYLSRLGWRYPTPTSGLSTRMTGAQRAANALFRIRLRLATLAALDRRAIRRRRAAGIANVFGDPEGHSAAARAVLAYSVFGLEYPFDAPDHLHLLGAMVPTQPAVPEPSALSDWLDRHQSVVYVCLGTMAVLNRAQLTELAGALDRLGDHHHVLWKLSAEQQRLLPAGLGDHIRLETWVPSQFEVLGHPHVRAFVSHGGGNGFHEGVHFGLPMLVMPFWMDCYDLAARAVDAGVGLALDRPPRFDAAEVTGKLRRLLAEPHFAARARYWADRMRDAGGVRRAADLILAALPAATAAAPDASDASDATAPAATVRPAAVAPAPAAARAGATAAAATDATAGAPGPADETDPPAGGAAPYPLPVGGPEEETGP